MTEPDDSDLAAAFEALHAPRSTADYARRRERSETRAPAHSWMRTGGAVLVVALVLGGAVGVVGLRNARNGAPTASSSGGPSGRVGAAMTYDSTRGATVMFGGFDGSGKDGAPRPLNDTWAWDGSGWQRLTAGPGPRDLVGVSLSDDPGDGGVLLIGTPQVNPATDGVVGCVSAGTGSVTGGVPGVVSPGSPPSLPSGSTAPPGAAVGSPPKATRAPGPTSTGPPAAEPPATPVATLPGAAPPLPSPPSGTVSPSCPTLPAPGLQTWLLDARGWREVVTSPPTPVDTPAFAAQLAYDPATGAVLAVAAVFAPPACSFKPGAMCPLVAGNPGSSSSSGAASGSGSAARPPSSSGSSSGSSSSSSSSAPPASSAPPPAAMPCRALADVSCGYGDATVRTWTWAHGRWTFRQPPSGAQPAPALGALLLAAGSGGRGQATLVIESSCGARAQRLPVGCVPGPASQVPDLQIWDWTGSGWTQVLKSVPETKGLSLAGAVGAVSGGRAVVVAPDGSTRTLDLRSGAIAAAGSVTARVGEAIAPGPSGTVVVFGGAPGPPALATLPTVGFGPPSSQPVGAPGADTWSWNGAWRHLSGPEPSAPPPSTPCPAVGLGKCGGPPVPSILPAPAPSGPALPATPSATPTPSPVPGATASP